MTEMGKIVKANRVFKKEPSRLIHSVPCYTNASPQDQSLGLTSDRLTFSPIGQVEVNHDGFGPRDGDFVTF